MSEGYYYGIRPNGRCEAWYCAGVILAPISAKPSRYTQAFGPHPSWKKAEEACLERFNQEPRRIGIYARRSEFGRWHRVSAFICPHCGEVTSLVINWHGPTPRGGYYSPCCGALLDFSGRLVSPPAPSDPFGQGLQAEPVRQGGFYPA